MPFKICTTKILRLYISRIIMTMASKSSNNILVDTMGHITTIGINRPGKRNCFDQSTVASIRTAIEDFKMTRIDGSCILPLVGMVAGGLELALLCDLRVMEATEELLDFYGRRFETQMCSSNRWWHCQASSSGRGLSRALDRILTGRSLTGKEAFEWGWLTDWALGQAITLASSLVKFPQECRLVDRESTYNAAYNKVYDELLKCEQEKTAKNYYLEQSKGLKDFCLAWGGTRDIAEWEREFNKDNIKKPKSKL
ncbi:hypothetical protein NQ317_005434 [Molorchus minor]|uniref:Enoyl-CoA hydratase n=1 Tax=Molorchus minor TaxID=1323400 RepID=A0ABQ9JHM8_9CUCU|nr:hypothetical protein NQ317_005434 [Molorchus minor]